MAPTLAYADAATDRISRYKLLLTQAGSFQTRNWRTEGIRVEDIEAPDDVYDAVKELVRKAQIK